MRQIEELSEKNKMTKLWLVIKDCDTKRVWTKYFENELEMNNYKNKIRFVKNLLLIEDSRDIEWR